MRSAIVRLRLLDGPALEGVRPEDGRAAVQQGKPLALLCYLAHEQRLVSRSILLSLFWPELDEERGRAALRKAIFLVRRGLGEEVVGNRGDRVGVSPDHVRCDTAEFQEALAAGDPARALSLYRGELLPGFHAPGAPEFERWVETTRARLRAAAEQASLRLAQGALREGDFEEGLRWARRAAEVSPESEEGVFLAMTALHGLGDHSRALEQYHHYAAHLQKEYGIGPSPRLREIRASIRSPAPVESRGEPEPDEPLERYRRFVEGAADLMYETDARGRVTYANAAVRAVAGVSGEQLVGRMYLELVREDYRDAMLAFYVRQVEERTPSTYCEFPGVHADGREIWLGQTAQLLEAAGKVVGMQVVARDITSQVRLAHAQRGFAFRDHETELYSERGFFALAEDRLKIARRTGHKLLLLCLEVRIAELPEREAGRTLVEVARLLESTFRGSDVVARLGERRFAMLALERHETDDQTWEYAVAGRLRQGASARPLGPGVALTLGIAYSGAPEACTAQQLLSISSTAPAEGNGCIRIDFAGS